MKALLILLIKKFSVEKSLLLALMGIETNFGTYVGKMDILSSLATLSFDKRRSEFFTKELITILQLVETQIRLITIYCMAHGQALLEIFSLCLLLLRQYAIDYDKNDVIELKSTKDSFASAANYINKIGWKKYQPCFIRVNLTEDVPKQILNTPLLKNYIIKVNLDILRKYIKNQEMI